MHTLSSTSNNRASHYGKTLLHSAIDWLILSVIFIAIASGFLLDGGDTVLSQFLFAIGIAHVLTWGWSGRSNDSQLMSRNRHKEEWKAVWTSRNILWMVFSVGYLAVDGVSVENLSWWGLTSGIYLNLLVKPVMKYQKILNLGVLIDSLLLLSFTAMLVMYEGRMQSILFLEIVAVMSFVRAGLKVLIVQHTLKLERKMEKVASSIFEGVPHLILESSKWFIPIAGIVVMMNGEAGMDGVAILTVLSILQVLLIVASKEFFKWASHIWKRKRVTQVVSIVRLIRIVATLGVVPISAWVSLYHFGSVNMNFVVVLTASGAAMMWIAVKSELWVSRHLESRIFLFNLLCGLLPLVLLFQSFVALDVLTLCLMFTGAYALKATLHALFDLKSRISSPSILAR